MTTPNLEQRMLDDVRAGKQIGVDIPLDHAFLIASGVRTERRLQEYLGKLDRIHQRFRRRYQENPELPREYSVAEQLFNFLMSRNKEVDEDKFRLNKVIDAFLDGNHTKIGNCLGTSMLYSLIGLREGLDLSVIRFDGHVCVRLRFVVDDVGWRNTIDLMAYPQFGRPVEGKTKEGHELPVIRLINEIYLSRMHQHYEKTRYDKAFSVYDFDALPYKVSKDEILTNRANLNIWQAKKERNPAKRKEIYRAVVEDSREAIRLNLNAKEAYLNLAWGLYGLGKVKEALRYCRFGMRYKTMAREGKQLYKLIEGGINEPK